MKVYRNNYNQDVCTGDLPMLALYPIYYGLTAP